MLDKKIKVKEIRDLGASNYLLTLSAPEQARLAQPGQFVMLKCSGDVDDNPLLRRPFSIFDVHPHPRTGRPSGLDLLVKSVGAGTRRLSALRAGDFVHVLGPQGHPFHVSQEMRARVTSAALVAGGVGIAAVFLLARSLIAQKITPVLFYGGRGCADLVLRDPFERLGIECAYTTEDGSMGERGFVTVPLERYLKARARTSVAMYACGPWAMMRAVHDLAVRYHAPCEVSLEARMGCSLGACMGCVIRGWDDGGEEQYLRVCMEGPVMNSRAVDWETYPF
jgi:dihydroorotate dehydrogenase electron transfer subunit